MKTTKYIISISFLIVYHLIAATPALADEVPITPYQASYKLYKGGIQVAKSSLLLEQSGRFWRWRLSTRPKGIYNLFSNKKPYSETTFSLLDGQYRIHNILLADEADDARYETARFNWDSRQVDIQRKGKRRIEDLPAQVYDFHTIHLLTAQMMKDGTQQMEINFYLKGEVLDAMITQTGKVTLEINGSKIETSVFQQTISGRKISSKYYYGPDSRLVPVKIEHTNSKGKTAIMLLNQVNRL
ncbi:MAG: DUF3108 domain-containing protein [Gammaproteobacteria bacterium]